VRSIYPAIDLQVAFDTKAYAGKIVLVTGASRGIGQAIALFYAKAVAKLVARSSLDESCALLLADVPDATIITFGAGVKDSARADEVVRSVVARFSKLDVLVAMRGIDRLEKTSVHTSLPPVSGILSRG